MIRPGCPVIVEGRYDRIRLSSIIDGIVLETGGFRIRKDKEMLSALRALAHSTGLIILTDSDAAGFQIRHFLNNALGKDAKLTHVYIPALNGKERRKRTPSAEGLLGVEGMDEEKLAAAFARAGVGFAQCDAPGSLNKADLLEARLIGVRDAAQRRRRLAASLSLPPRLSSETLLRLLNTFLTRNAFFDLIKDLNWQEFAASKSPHDALSPTEN
jgi:ribonuclease M5